MEVKKGLIEVVCGGMFSGKTAELIRRVQRAEIAKQKVQIFKPKIDDRFSKNHIVTRSHNSSLESIVVVPPSINILDLIDSDTDVVGIDEAQFFDNGIINVCTTLADRGVRVIVAGLDMDFRRQPFGPMPFLLAIAESVHKFHAVCVECHSDASFSYKTSGGEEVVEVGNHYKALCRECLNKAEA